MADLLPSSPDTSAVEDANPRVVGVDSDDADDLIAALSSETARALIAALHDDPANPAKLADRVDTTIQNAQYHLEKLEDAGLIEVVDTVYSEKGREMNVYAPSDRPLVVVAGQEERTSGLKTALSRLLGAVAALGVGSAIVQQLVSGDLLDGIGMGSEPPDGVAAPTDSPTATPAPTEDAGTFEAADTGTPTPAPDATPTPAPTGEPATATPMPTGTSTPTAVELAEETATEVPRMAAEVGPQVEPGVLFFAGGLAVLAAVLVIDYIRG